MVTSARSGSSLVQRVETKEHDGWTSAHGWPNGSWNTGPTCAVAYRMLGSLAEADDAVQEAWVRLERSDTADIENLKGWLTTVVSRVCLDVLRSRHLRREEPLGAYVPDPIVDGEGEIDPEHEALLADSVGLALLAVLDTLTPAERLAFVLHDTFGMPFGEIAPMVGPYAPSREEACEPGAAPGAAPGVKATSPASRSAGSPRRTSVQGSLRLLSQAHQEAEYAELWRLEEVLRSPRIVLQA